MVETKMDSSVQACSVMPLGVGTRNFSTTPMAHESKRGTGLAPCKQGQHVVQVCLAQSQDSTNKAFSCLTGHPLGAAASAGADSFAAAACETANGTLAAMYSIKIPGSQVEFGMLTLTLRVRRGLVEGLCCTRN